MKPVLQLGDVHEGDVLPALVYDVTATTVILGAMASRDWRPMHHDKDFAINRNGVKDIFLNTPTQAQWFERYLTDWTGPHGRLGKMMFRMRDSVFAGDTMVLTGTVTSVETDEVGCGWANVAINVEVDGDVMTTCAARIALPVDENDNPWRRRGDEWRPDA